MSLGPSHVVGVGGEDLGQGLALSHWCIRGVWIGAQRLTEVSGKCDI